VAGHLADIGGAKGFHSPINAALAAYIAANGATADADPIKGRIREHVDSAQPGPRTEQDIARYKSDRYLDGIIHWLRDREKSKPSPQPDPNGGKGAAATIQVTAGHLHQAADAGLAAMARAGVAFYQRDKSLVRVCLVKAKNADGENIAVPGVVKVAPAILRRALGQSARWERFNSKGKLIRIDPPKDLVEQIESMVGEWPFPAIAGVIGTPTLRPDGSLLDKKGYDEATGLVLLGAPQMPDIPDRPTKDAACRSLDLLDVLLDGFPFVNPESRAVALSMIMTPVLRAAVPPAVPIHLITKPQPGTGASYLADIASIIATGEHCAAIAVGTDPHETQKQLISAALSGFPIISLDNCRVPLEGDFLCQVTERPLMQLRPFGKLEVVRVPNSFTTFANGNNAVVADDVVRRTISCALDANMENPETRIFSADPLAMARADRGRYVAACLTIARAYFAAGQPERLARLPSYARWSDLVRSALVWLGRADPVSTMAAERSRDPVRQTRADVFEAWARDLGAGRYLTSELIQKAEEWNTDTGAHERPALRAALLAVAANRSATTTIDARRLGIWLSAAENTVALGFKLTVDRGDKQRARYAVQAQC
jgi:putative DNA primase/helicase